MEPRFGDRGTSVEVRAHQLTFGASMEPRFGDRGTTWLLCEALFTGDCFNGATVR